MSDPAAQDHPCDPIAALLQRIRPRLLRFLSRSGIPALDREDLMQDALVELIAKWPLIRDPEPWLLGTLRNKCLSYARGRQKGLLGRFVVVDSDALERLAGPAPPQDHDGRLDLARLFRALPARQRRILWLFYGLGLSEREMSESGPVATSGAVQSLHKDRWRAISHLRRALVGTDEHAE
jgi:RNA polymerase sigma-70 factor (ECF subfamily)